MLDLQRTENWQHDLLMYLAEIAPQSGEIGQHDCVIFSAGAVHAMTGWYPDPSLFDYRSIVEGHRSLNAMGYATLAAYLDDHFPTQAAVFARPGDLVLVLSDDGEALGVMQGEMAYVVGPHGLGLYPANAVLASWKVG